MKATPNSRRRCPVGRRATASASNIGISQRSELADYQPGLAPSFIRGTFVPGWKTVSDPKNLGKAIWRYAEQQGAVFVRGDVGLALPQRGRIAVQLKRGRTIMARQLVIAAGAWSHLLAQQFGDRVPLETERGYNTTLPKTAFDVKRQLIFPGHGFVITPLETGLRVGGAVELGGLQRPPNFARSKAMLEKAKRFLPGLDASRRPRMDGLSPVAARFAAGHRSRALGAERLLRIRPRPSRPDAGRGDGAADPRPRDRCARPRLISRPFRRNDF